MKPDILKSYIISQLYHNQPIDSSIIEYLKVNSIPLNTLIYPHTSDDNLYDLIEYYNSILIQLEQSDTILKYLCAFLALSQSSWEKESLKIENNFIPMILYLKTPLKREQQLLLGLFLTHHDFKDKSLKKQCIRSIISIGRNP